MSKTHIFADKPLKITRESTEADVKGWLDRKTFCGLGRGDFTALNESYVKKFRRRDYCKTCLAAYRRRHAKPGKVLQFGKR